MPETAYTRNEKFYSELRKRGVSFLNEGERSEDPEEDERLENEILAKLNERLSISDNVVSFPLVRFAVAVSLTPPNKNFILAPIWQEVVDDAYASLKQDKEMASRATVTINDDVRPN